MPAFIRCKWEDYRVAIIPSMSDKKRKALFIITKHELIPYLWGANIYFDLTVIPPKNYNSSRTIEYSWKLYKKEDKSPVKTSRGTFRFSEVKSPRKPITGDIVRGWNGWHRNGFIKFQAVNLGYISATDQYKVTMQFNSEDGTMSEELPMAEFTIRDRDEFYTQIMWALIGAGLTAFGGIVTTIILWAIGVL